MASARPEPVLTRYEYEPDRKVAVWEWKPVGDENATLVLLHATNFHSRSWDKVVRMQPVTTRVVCIDLPGHGHSDAPAGPGYTWRSAATAAMHAIRVMNIHPGSSTLVGHSFGGWTACAVGGQFAEKGMAFSEIILIDPVIRTKEALAGPQPSFVERIQKQIGGRKAAFRSAEEMYNRFKDRAAYKVWDADMLWDYCHHGLSEADESGMRHLLCKPRTEASCYLGGQEPSACLDSEIDALRRSSTMCTVVRARPPVPGVLFSGSTTNPRLAELLGAQDMLFPAVGHFIPQEIPKVVAGIIQSRVHAKL
eukprot:TRINITY_DN3059_c1_g4_i1.p1 TRINITY_DN3059_c1_g4~~TRINITY_DN3059_c1_g4_i1.p1  ORF type:complete len:329 (+),score=23.70 TRINITY_DN3059_c1_g4_i1:66-989(+)